MNRPLTLIRSATLPIHAGRASYSSAPSINRHSASTSSFYAGRESWRPPRPIPWLRTRPTALRRNLRPSLTLLPTSFCCRPSHASKSYLIPFHFVQKSSSSMTKPVICFRDSDRKIKLADRDFSLHFPPTPSTSNEPTRLTLSATPILTSEVSTVNLRHQIPRIQSPGFLKRSTQT